MRRLTSQNLCTSRGVMVSRLLQVISFLTGCSVLLALCQKKVKLSRKRTSQDVMVSKLDKQTIVSEFDTNQAPHTPDLVSETSTYFTSIYLSIYLVKMTYKDEVFNFLLTAVLIGSLKTVLNLSMLGESGYFRPSSVIR